jgi:hypothetical protein
MIESYYSAREWNKDGTIPHSKILELNLDNLGAKVHQSTP